MNISTLIGKTITDVQGFEVGSDEILFTCSDGKQYRMHHDQDCCESVYVKDIVGDVFDLRATVLSAAEDSREAEVGEASESGTWTFYNIQTTKGALTVSWLGESNGYYSEAVDFEEV